MEFLGPGLRLLFLCIQTWNRCSRNSLRKSRITKTQEKSLKVVSITVTCDLEVNRRFCCWLLSCCVATERECLSWWTVSADWVHFWMMLYPDTNGTSHANWITVHRTLRWHGEWGYVFSTWGGTFKQIESYTVPYIHLSITLPLFGKKPRPF